MGFLKDIVGGAVKGIKTLVQNARVGAQAKAAGFIQPTAPVVTQATQTAAVAKSNNIILIVVGSVLAFITILTLLFKKK
jgi:hypothetical protein